MPLLALQMPAPWHLDYGELPTQFRKNHGETWLGTDFGLPLSLFPRLRRIPGIWESKFGAASFPPLPRQAAASLDCGGEWATRF